MAAVFLLLASVSLLAAPGLSAALDRDMMGLGETATLTLTFTGAATAEAPPMPSVANLTFTPVGKSSQFQLINGASSSSIIFTFQVASAAAGDFVIPSIRADVGGKIIASAPLKLKVAQGQALAPTDEKLPAFLKMILPKTNVYLGESFPLEIQLYCQEAQDLTLPQLQSDGFTVGQMPQPTQTRTRIGTEIYNLVIFKMAVAPTKAGALNLGPATCSLKLLTGPRNFFGQFTQAKPVTLKSDPQILQVLPLPDANKPPGFNGAIGNFSMTFEASPTNLAVGDPITLKLKISGRGSLDLLSLPTQAAWRDFKTYPPTSKTDSSDPLGLEGSKSFEQVVVPENSSIKELPPFLFSFFDPQTKTYRTLNHAPVPLVVRPTSATPQPTVFSSNPEPAEASGSRDIAHIKAQPGTMAIISSPLVRQSWFWLLQSIAPLAWVVSVYLRKRRESFANNPRLRRQREVEQSVARGLKELTDHAAANDAENFFATLFRLLQEQIGERLDRPASAISGEVVENNLRPAGCSPATLEMVHELFRACDQARYAGHHTSEELASLIPKTEEALAQLRKIK